MFWSWKFRGSNWEPQPDDLLDNFKRWFGVAPPSKKWLKHVETWKGRWPSSGLCLVQVHKQAPLKATAEAKEEADEADVPNWLNYSPRILHFSLVRTQGFDGLLQVLRHVRWSFISSIGNLLVRRCPWQLGNHTRQKRTICQAIKAAKEEAGQC